MKLTLMVEGSAAVIAQILASLPDGAIAMPTPNGFTAMDTGQSMPAPVPPMPSAGGGDGDDDTGPVNANAPALDSTGLPWDGRIHAATKTVKGDGSWTGKRGGPKGDELAAIEAQLRASVGGGQPAPAPVMQPAPAPMPMPAVAMPATAPMQPAPMQPAPMMPAPAPVVASPPQPAPVAMPVPQPAPTPIPTMPAPEPAPVAAAIPQADPATVASVAQATGTLDFAQFMQHLSGQMSKRDGAGAPLVHADYLAGITKEISDAFAPFGVAPLSAITDIATNPQMITYASQLMQRDGRW